MEVDSSFSYFSPLTPALTPSPSTSTTATPSPLLFPDLLPHDNWLPTDAAHWLLSPHRDELAPGALLLHAPELIDDPRPKKRSRHASQKLAHHEPHDAAPPPTVVAIPPAQLSDIPPDLAKKPQAPRKRPAQPRAASRSGSRALKRKEPSPAPAAAPPPQQQQQQQPQQPQQPQPIRFRFVSVQHAESSTSSDSSTAEFEEHMEDDVYEGGPFEHGPSEFPPRPYPGGDYALSPLKPPPKTGKIPASSLDFLPVLEERFTRLEAAIEKYAQMRARDAVRNSILPHATEAAASEAAAASSPSSTTEDAITTREAATAGPTSP